MKTVIKLETRVVKIGTCNSERDLKDLVRDGDGRLKTTEPIAHGRVRDTEGASLALSPSIGQSRREQLPELSAKVVQRKVPVMVPVLSVEGKPLMPCHPARARELIKKKGAKERWYRGIYVIQLIHRNEGVLKNSVCGIDSGFYREAFTVQSFNHTYINVLSDAVCWVGTRVENRRNSRKSRRGRNLPCRKSRSNRMNKKSWLAPSIKSRWDIKLRIIYFLRKLYPITTYVVEDIKAKNKKNCRKWNRIFSPLQTGKNWFYDRVEKVGELILKVGYETYTRRNMLGFKKLKDKFSDSFYSHNVDSWVLASFVTGKRDIDTTKVFRMIPLKFHRRVIHNLSPAKGGHRKKFGGTRSLGFKRGSVIKHSELGYAYIGGNTDGRVTVHNVVTGSILTSRAFPTDCKFLYYNNWRTVFIDECGNFIGKRHRNVFLKLEYCTPEIVAKKRQTNLERYGVEKYTNREQAKKTSLERYGIEYTCAVPEFIEKRVATLIERYGKVFNVDEPHNKFHLEDKEKFIQDYESGLILGDLAIKYKISEPTLNRIIKELGLSRAVVKVKSYSIDTPSEATSGYLKACLENNKAFSFYEYGKIRGQQYCTKMKRWFNAGKPYNHLLEELKSVALYSDKHDTFLKKLK
jgi:hypothetical protein